MAFPLHPSIHPRHGGRSDWGALAYLSLASERATLTVGQNSCIVDLGVEFEAALLADRACSQRVSGFRGIACARRGCASGQGFPDLGVQSWLHGSACIQRLLSTRFLGTYAAE